MSMDETTFADLDLQKGIAALPPNGENDMPLEAWYRAVWRTPVGKLTIGDLGRAVRQGVLLDIVVPLAVSALQNDILSGEYYDGELLLSLCTVEQEFWRTHDTICEVRVDRLAPSDDVRVVRREAERVRS